MRLESAGLRGLPLTVDRMSWPVTAVLGLAARVSVSIVLATVPGRLPAQVTDAAQAITARSIEHDLGVLGNDSMPNWDTPGPGVESTAQYIADQFSRFGLL